MRLLYMSAFYRNERQKYDSGTEEEETIQEKRLRLAKQYLQEIEEKGTIYNTMYRTFLHIMINILHKFININKKLFMQLLHSNLYYNRKR